MNSTPSGLCPKCRVPMDDHQYFEESTAAKNDAGFHMWDTPEPRKPLSEPRCPQRKVPA